MKELKGKSEVVKKDKPKTPATKATKQEIINKAGGSSDKSTSRLKGEVKYVQKGVTSAKGESGSYIYYKDPRKGGINPETDREFVNKSGMQTASQTNEMRKYNAKK